MRLLDSRRLTGPGLVLDRPGAVADVEVADDRRDEAIAAWWDAATRMLGAVGWSDERLVARRFEGGASLGITAPPDSLYSATDLNEWAWSAAEAMLSRRPAPEFGAAAERLRQAIAGERNPLLLAIRIAARSRGLTFLSGEGLVSVCSAGRSATSPIPGGSRGRGPTRSRSRWSPGRTGRRRSSG
jgi:cyanophycin synthetase